jgi:hypothetical protein
MKAILVLALVLSVIAAFAIGCRRTQPHHKAPTDDDVIEQLRLAGSDLTKPHPTDFYLYVPSEEAANRIARALTTKNFNTKVRPAATGSNWLVLASKELMLSPGALAEIRTELTALALSEFGEYDGWEAEVVKK